MTQQAAKRRIPWRSGAIAGLALIILATWWFVGRKVWTDEHGLSVVDGQGRLREILWNTPKPLGDWFDGTQQLYEPSLSPDGTELYFVAGKPGKNADIYVSYRRNNEWTTPEPVKAINTKYDELGPRVTADGKFLLFYSDRPGGFGGYDIWASARGKNGWGKPFNLGPSVNSEFNEFTPDPTPDGKHLIFATNRVAAKKLQPQAWRATIRENEAADYDLWIAELKEPTDASPPAEIPQPRPATQPATGPSQLAGVIPPAMDFSDAHEIPGINTPFVEGASCMSPAGDFLYFASNRPGGFGKFDIWRSRVSSDWKFGPAENAGAEINSADNETDPTLAFNGYRLVFSSDRGSDNGTYRLYSSDSREVYAMRQGRPIPHLGASFWLFLLSLITLIPLLLFLRGWDDRHLNVVQKCLVLSALFHLLILLAFTFIFVSQDAIKYARQQLGVEVAINLNPAPEAEIGTLIRRQSTGSDLPTLGAPMRAEKITQTPMDTAIARGPVDVAVPRAQRMDDQPAPVADIAHLPPTVKTEPVAMQPVVPNTDAPRDPLDIHVNARQVSQIETKPQVESAAGSISRTTIEPPPMPDRAPVAPTNAMAQAKPAPLTIDPGPVAMPKLPAGGLTDSAPVAPVLPTSAREAPTVDLKTEPAAKVTGTDAPIPTAANEPKGNVTTPLQTASAAPAASRDAAQTAEPTHADSTATTPPTAPIARIFHPAPAPMVPDSPAPSTAEVNSKPDPVTPKSTAMNLPVAGGQSSAPQVQEATTGIERQQGPAVADVKPAGVDAPAPQASAPAASKTSPVDAPSASPVAHAVNSVVTGPTTLPSEASASPIGPAPAPELHMQNPVGVRPGPAGDQAAGPVLPTGPVGGATGPIATGSAPFAGGPEQIDTNAAPSSRPGAGTTSAVNPLSGIHVNTQVAGATEVAGPAIAIPGAVDGPQIILPHAAQGLPSAHPAASGAGDKALEPVAGAFNSKQMMHGPEGGGTKDIPLDIPGPALAKATLPHESGTGLDPISSRPHIIPLAQSTVGNVVLPSLPGDINGERPNSPFALRAPEMHTKIIEKLGGTKQSEDAVAKALFWLADNQEDNGRWTMAYDARGGRRHPRGAHDTAMTGLTLLAFLAQDHRPDKAGPYRETVSKGLQYLLDEQKHDGDLRGDQAGPGANQGNMYDQGMATYAMAEAALLTHDPRYTDSAMRAADFIVNGQNFVDGGWRYAPREAGDSSVFGWQIMALHSAEELGFKIPVHTRAGIDHYISIATSGRYGMLTGYQPRREATPTMTAQMAFARMLLGKQFSEEEMGEASDFLSRKEVRADQPELYYWYYASLCMSQMKTPAWKKWNTKTRDALISMQHPEGEHGGYWQAEVYKGQYNDRVLATAIGALTLEVYYRFMPMQAAVDKTDKPEKDAK